MNPDMARRAPAWLGGVTAGLAIVGGIGYIIDCRVARRDLDSCWMTGYGMITRASDLALGAAAGGVVGFWTKNPALHRREDGRPTDPDS